jgi:DNA-binding MarR family transcriptional regulator
MARPRNDLADLWYLVRKSAALMDRTGDALFRSELGVSLTQFLILSTIDAHPGALNQQSLADLIGVTKGTVSRQIDIAAATGLLTSEASPTSRRENVIALTDAGTALVRRGDEIAADARRLGVPEFDPQEFAATVRVLTRFIESMEAVEPRRTPRTQDSRA